jgi:hypothetical protein
MAMQIMNTPNKAWMLIINDDAMSEDCANDAHNTHTSITSWTGSPSVAVSSTKQ